MRVLLQVDMEGVSRITNVRQIVPIWPQYWKSGTTLLTDDVVAAIHGLLQGGATEVVVDDQHQGGPTNIIVERLPSDVTMPGSAVIYRELREGTFDAVFQVGRHARWGTNDGFVAHTQMPGLALTIDGASITESHICALRAGAPVLGIVGDDRLGPQIDGVIAETPFLTVKQSTGLMRTRPVYSTVAQSREAIQTFAKSCMLDWRSRVAPVLPNPFTFCAFIVDGSPHDVAAEFPGASVQDGVIHRTCEDWWSDAEPLMQAATFDASKAIIEGLRSIDMSSAEAIEALDLSILEEARTLFTTWLTQPQIAWRPAALSKTPF